MMRIRRLLLATLGVLAAGLVFAGAPALAAAPELTSESISRVTPFEAFLSAKFKPNDQAMTFLFEYATKATGEMLEGTVKVIGEEGFGAGYSDEELTSYPFLGETGHVLTPATTYYYRAVVRPATGTISDGKVEPFTTPPREAPKVESESVSGVTPYEATLDAEVNPDSQITTYAFEYSTKASGEALEGVITTLTGPEAIGPVFGGQAIGVPIGHLLAPATTYYYRVTAKNETGTTKGKVESFTTPPLEAPKVESESVSGVTPYEATLNAQAYTDYQPTAYSFEYSTKATGETLEGAVVTITAEGAGVSSASTGHVLAPATTYYYRVVAANGAGTTKGKVEPFETPPLEAPVVEGESASLAGGIAPFDANLDATINLDSQEITYSFEYSTKATGETLEGTITTVQGGSFAPGPPGGQQVGVSTGNVLQPVTTYYYRVVAKNATGTNTGKVETFTTPGPPLVGTGAVSAIGQASANVTGTVTPEGAETYYYYEYGPTTEYGQSTVPAGPGVSVGSGTSAVVAPASLLPLVAGVSYHYRLVAWNEFGTSYGQDKTFTAEAGVSPLATTGAPSGVSVDEATISGTINPQGKETSYGFEYGATTEYGTQTFGTVLPEYGTETVTLNLRGISPGTTYHYRLVVRNAGGTSYGEDMTFTTLPIAFPIIAPTPPPLLALPSFTFPTGSEPVTKPGKTKKHAKKTHGKKTHGKKKRKGAKKSAQRSAWRRSETDQS